MLNIVEKYSAETVAETEEGVVGIEYVLLAAIVALAIGALAGPLDGLAGRLGEIIGDTVG
jgi:Flp pilus assembly pilin Flp